MVHHHFQSIHHSKSSRSIPMPSNDVCSGHNRCSRPNEVAAFEFDCLKNDFGDAGHSSISIDGVPLKTEPPRMACCATLSNICNASFGLRRSACSTHTNCVRTLPHQEITDAPTSPSSRNKDFDILSPASSHAIVEANTGCQTKFEHVTINVQGMTCTSCEKALSSSLQSLSGISNIKTSLLLSQAEFHLEESTFINLSNIAAIIERKTGFVCSRVLDLGEELDLIVAGKAVDLGNDWPAGIANLTDNARNVVRVSYRPRIIGARDLLSHPFFGTATLAPPPQPPSLISGQAHLRHEFFMTVLSTVLTVPVLVLAYGPYSQQNPLYGGISLGLATLVQTIVGWAFYARAFKGLIYSQLVEMDMLVVLSTSTAYFYSVIAYSFLVARRPLSTPEFFETSTLLMTLIMAGRVVSAYARQKAVESISIEALQISFATILDPITKQLRDIDARLLQYGDIFQVLPEMSIVTDGVVIEGNSEVDEAQITGEGTLITKEPGMSVVAGSQNHAGALLVKLTRLPSENTIKTIGAMVDEAKSSKPRVQEIADRVARGFIPIILIVTVTVFVVWVAVEISVRGQNATKACINAMTYAISVLVISCPCAIGLAVPMVVVTAGGVGAKHGLIMKSAEAMDIGRKISHVVFDKTGTLTQGKLSVMTEEYLDNVLSSITTLILSLTSNSNHPVSIAVAAHLRATKPNVETKHLGSLLSIPGKGIETIVGENIIRAGNPFWLGFEDTHIVCGLLQRGLTIFCVAINGELTAVFGLEDELRPDAREMVNALRRRSINISLISGDNEAAVNRVAHELGIPSEQTRAQCSPTDKASYVQSLSLLSLSKNTVLFCGDGTNDAVALAQASIGMHINEGTDVAQNAADAVLMRPSLKVILTLIDLSKAFHKRVVFNFAWSFVYNLFAILLAAGVFPNVRIPPAYAGVGEMISVLPVIGIALALRWEKF